MRARRGNFSHVDKTLDEKILSCRKLVIQSLERTIHQRMFYDYVRDSKLGGQIAQFRVNSGDGIIKLTFNTPEQAMNFYQGKNFTDGLLARKFNIYFDLSASEAEVKKYFLRGINEVKIRKAFQKCREYGLVKMNILYGHNKMKDTCILCYLRTQPLSIKQFTALAAELQSMYIMLDHFKQKNGNKSQIKMDKSQLKMMDFQMERDQAQMLEHEVEKIEQIAQLPKKMKEGLIIMTLITNHGEYQNAITQKDQKILSETQKFMEVSVKDVEINRFKIPTLDSKQNKALLVRDIQFPQAKIAFQKFSVAAQWLKDPIRMIQGMVYLHIKGKISTLILVRPERYMVKSREGRCTIFSRTEEKDKLVKLAELEYEQVEDFICQQEKLMVNFYKSSEIEVFGRHFDYNPDDDW